MAVDQAEVISQSEVEDLVRAAQAGDAQAFEQLYALYAPRVHGYLRGQLRGRPEDAEDLTAEVFTRVYERIGSFQFRGVPFLSWLFRIAHNQLIDSYRRYPKHELLPLEDAFTVAEPKAGQAFAHQLSVNQLDSALLHLTDEQRQVLQLRYLQGLSTAQAAEAVGKSEEAAKKLQARGLAALKRSMDCPSGCWRIEP
jgi:RNA polymerase sigma-70 factor (ECF subfamily)